MYDLSGRTPGGAADASGCKGSFDCVVVRFADENFAQDDKAFGG